jgi:hypothetical protein
MEGLGGMQLLAAGLTNRICSAQQPGVYIYTPEGLLNVQYQAARKEYRAYDPTSEDTMRALTIVSYGCANNVYDGLHCEDITRTVLASNKNGGNVVEPIEAHSLSQLQQRGWYGPPSFCRAMVSKFRMEDLPRVRNSKGEFTVINFGNGTIHKEAYTVHGRYLKSLNIRTYAPRTNAPSTSPAKTNTAKMGTGTFEETNPRLFTTDNPEPVDRSLSSKPREDVPLPPSGEAREACPNNPDPTVYGCVTYRVEGAEPSAEVHILNETGGSETHTVRLPWTMQFVAPLRQTLYVSVYHGQHRLSGLLSAVIYVNGKVIQSAKGDGYNVTVSGFVRIPKVDSNITFGGPVEKGAAVAPKAGNTTHWNKPGATQEEFMKDRFECLQCARQEARSAANDRGAPVLPSCEVWWACLGARGYTLDPNGNVSVPPGMEAHCQPSIP